MRLLARILFASAFSWLSFAVMTCLAVWNEGRPAKPFHDPILAAVPYVPWVSDANYWIWLALWIPGLAAILVVTPRVFPRVMIASGVCSLLRGVCIVATGLVPYEQLRASDPLARAL